MYVSSIGCLYLRVYPFPGGDLPPNARYALQLAQQSVIEWLTKLASYFPLLPVVRERLALKDDEIKRLTDLNTRLSQQLKTIPEPEALPQQSKFFIPTDLVATAVRSALGTGQYTRFRVLSYTTETLDNFVPYDARNTDLYIQLLVRDPTAERRDEVAFNLIFGGRVPRPWKKADAIEDMVRQPWPYKSKRAIRYYVGLPSLKAFILTGERKSEAFFGFYRWHEIPAEGGSQFKGSRSPMVHLTTSTDDEVSALETLNSQFESMWVAGKPAHM